MASTADFRNGLCILHNGELYTIAEFQHVKPGKGPAFVRTKLRNVKTGRILTNTFTSGVKIEIQRVERRQYQYLYSDGDIFHFMNSENFEQTFLDKSLIPAPDLLKEGQEVWVKLLGFDDRGKVRLAMKMVNQETGEEMAAEDTNEG